MAEKKMYVVRSRRGFYWAGYGWEDQLRKARIFVSLRYAADIVKRFKGDDPVIVEVFLTEGDTVTEVSDG